jgi:alpha-galactosidase
MNTLLSATCETPTDVCPDLVPVAEFGAHVSYVPVPGVRRWTFDSVTLRDRFLQRVAEGGFRRARHPR